MWRRSVWRRSVWRKFTDRTSCGITCDDISSCNSDNGNASMDVITRSDGDVGGSQFSLRDGSGGNFTAIVVAGQHIGD